LVNQSNSLNFNELLARLTGFVDDVELDIDNSLTRSAAIPIVKSIQPNRHTYAHNGQQQQQQR